MTLLVSFDEDNYKYSSMVDKMADERFQPVIIEGDMSGSELDGFTSYVEDFLTQGANVVVYTETSSMPAFALEAYTWLKDHKDINLFIAGNI